MDAGYVLAWIVGVSSGLSIVLAVFRPGYRQTGWLAVHSAVLIVLAAVSAVASLNTGGQVAAAVWVPTVLVPSLLARRLPIWIRDRRFALARRGARLIRLLHPADGWEFQLEAVDAMAAMDTGDLNTAQLIISRIPEGRPLRRSLTAAHLRATGDFLKANEWLSSLPTAARSEASVVILEARTAGELGDMRRLAAAVFHAQNLLVAPADAASAGLMLSAFSGDVTLTEDVLEQAFGDLPTDAREFWRATAEQRAGIDATPRLRALRDSEHPMTQAAARRRLDHPLVPVLEPLDLEPLRADLRSGRFRPPPRIRPTVTYGICALLLAVFVFELPGGSEDPQNLFDLGALVVPMLPGEEWRVLSAGLLHFGWLHLTLNVLALLYFGRQVETRLGHTWTFMIFWLSSVGAMSILAATVPGDSDPGVVVGASGGLMGVLGAVIVGVAIRYAKERRRPQRRQLFVLGFIVAFQTVFDAATPQVSGAVHLYGLAIGFALGGIATVAKLRPQPLHQRA